MRTALLLGVLVAAGCGKPPASTTVDVLPSPSSPAAIAARKRGVTASDLCREFNDNYGAANRRYNGKRLTVTGEIAQISEFDTVMVLLRPGVNCRFPLDRRGQTDKLKTGQQVIIQGQFSDFQPLLGGVILGDCDVVE